MMKMNDHLTNTVLVTGLLLATTASHGQTRGPHEPVHALDLGAGARSLVLRLHFDGREQVTLESATVTDGRAPARIGNPPLLGFRLTDNAGGLIETFDAWHPLWAHEWDASGEHLRILPEASGRFVMPYTPDLASIEVSDIPLDQQVIEVGLADLAVARFEAVDPPTRVLVGEAATLQLRTVVENLGALSPVDGTVSVDATAPPGGAVDPVSSEVDVPAIERGERRSVTHTVSLRCHQPGLREFDLDSRVGPREASTADLDPTNDTKSLSLTVDCLLPVAVNNKPGSNPNSVGSSGSSFAVAVLTTRAGEYGLPLAFDATRVDVATVRFGSRTAVFEGTGGGSEIHGTGHPEDSRERIGSEKERDGDTDMVLHFDPGQAGLTPSDDVGCTTGEYLDPVSGTSLRFFGCDTVDVQ